MNSEYNLLLPTSAEPQGGFTPSSQIDFVMNHPNKCLSEQTLRLTGTLSVTNDGDPLTTEQFLSLNPYAGAHSLINHLIILFDGNQVELNTEYARFVAAESECKNSNIELGANTNEIIELKSPSQDGIRTQLQQLQLLGENIGANASKITFSILLRCCLNKTSTAIPFNKSGPIRIRCILREPTDIFYGPNIATANVTYTVSQVCLRYQTHDDHKLNIPCVMERVQYTGQQTLQSSYNTFSTLCPTSFDSCIMVFRDQTHTNTTNFSYDPILNENFLDSSVTPSVALIPNYVEWTLSSQDTPLSFPLRTQEEMLTNYILAHNKSLTKHGLGYSKLNQTNLPNLIGGFGLGCYFGVDIPSMPLQTTINFANTPVNKYNVYIFYKGKMAI